LPFALIEAAEGAPDQEADRHGCKKGRAGILSYPGTRHAFDVAASRLLSILSAAVWPISDTLSFILACGIG
jgi:hypothetical protein